MLTQFYIVEVKKFYSGEFEHQVHFAYDEDPRTAKLKAESKYHEVLASAAISETETHSAILFTTEGEPLMHECYYHVVEEEEE